MLVGSKATDVQLYNASTARTGTRATYYEPGSGGPFYVNARPYDEDRPSIVQAAFGPPERWQVGVDPVVTEAVRGSFTAPDADETLFVVVAGVQRSGDRLLVTRGGEVIGVVNTDGMGTSIGRLSDLDRDGKTELLLTDGWTRQGEMESRGRIVEWSGSGLSVLADLGELAGDDCGTPNPNATQHEATVTFDPEAPDVWKSIQTASVVTACGAE